MLVKNAYIYRLKSQYDICSYFFLRLDKDMYEDFIARGLCAKKSLYKDEYFIRVYPIAKVRLSQFLERNDIDISFRITIDNLNDERVVSGLAFGPWDIYKNGSD